jgi:predicted  nucleic acid-binding Zn-ribbon protein
MTLDSLKVRRAKLRGIMKNHKIKLEHVRILHEQLYNSFKELQNSYREIELEIAELEGAVKKIATRKTQKPATPAMSEASLKSLVAQMTPTQRAAFVASLVTD